MKIDNSKFKIMIKVYFILVKKNHLGYLPSIL